MSKKYNSEKRIINPNRKFHAGDEIINKLENLYHQSLRAIKYSSQMDINEKIFDKIIPLNKQFSSLEKKSFSNRYINPNQKSLYRYGSIDSIIKKNPQQQSLSNDPPTVDISGKNLSPRNGNIKSNIFDSSSKYKLKSELKVVSEIKDSNNKKEFKIKNKNEDEVNYKDISLYSNKSDNNQNFSSNKDYIDENQKDILLKSDENRQKKGKNNKKEEKKLNVSISESSLGSYKPDKKEFPHFQKDYYSSMLNDYISKRREKLIQSSTDFYLHQQKFMSKTSNFKKKEYNFNLEKKKSQVFSELKRVPNIIAFGKVVPKESVKIQKQNKKHIYLRPKKTLGHNNNTKNIFRKGLINKNSIENLKELKLIKDDYNTNNPNTEDYIPKDQFGNIVYPILVQKKNAKKYNA